MTSEIQSDHTCLVYLAGLFGASNESICVAKDLQTMTFYAK